MTLGRKTGGRQKEFPRRITLPLSEEMLADLDSVLEANEDRVEAVREAIGLLVAKRRRKPS